MKEMTAFRMGEPVRRLRPLLPDQARRTRTPTGPITPTSAAGCWTGRPAAARDYKNRTAKVQDCVRLTPRNISSDRLAAADLRLSPRGGEGKISTGGTRWFRRPGHGAQAGVSVRGKVDANENEVQDKDLEDHIVSWPVR